MVYRLHHSSRRSPFDPFEDTESVSRTSKTKEGTSRRSPFDPFEDTESATWHWRDYPDCNVAAHSIRSRILKEEQG